MVIVEQDVAMAQRVSQRIYCLQEGRVSLAGRDRTRSRASRSRRPTSASEGETDARRVDTVLQGLLLGGLYALFALGQSLMFGVMRLTNTAQGDFIVLGALRA